MITPSCPQQEEEEISSKLLLSRRARTLQNRLVHDLKASVQIEEEVQEDSSREEEFETPRSPLGSSLRAIRRARAFASREAALLAVATAKDCLVRLSEKDQHDKSELTGLSQAALDQLTGGVEHGDSDGKECEMDEDDSEDNYLLQQKRHRAFPDLPLTRVSKMPSRGDNGENCSGLSQADLDDHCVHEPASEVSTDCTECAEALWEQESALLRIKRLKAFRGPSEACAMTEHLMDTKIENGNGRGLSQADLDNLCVQESIHGVTPNSVCSPTQNTGKHGETSPIGQEGMMLRARRMRAFLGSETAATFAERALAEAVHSDPQQSSIVDTGVTSSILRSRRGTSQLELDMLCVQDTDEFDKSVGVRSPASQVATPQRKRSPKKVSGSSPERGGA